MSTISWTTRRDEKARRIKSIAHLTNRAVLKREDIVEALEHLLQPRDRVVLEGDNQKQASFLSKALLQVSREKVNKLHMIMSSISITTQLSSN